MLMRIQLTFQDLIKNDEELPTSKNVTTFLQTHDTENRIHTLAATESDGSLPLRELRYRPPQKIHPLKSLYVFFPQASHYTFLSVTDGGVTATLQQKSKRVYSILGKCIKKRKRSEYQQLVRQDVDISITNIFYSKLKAD